jgi:class 3 adenylate cyclase
MAMARFCAQCGTRLPDASRPVAENERRQLSVILCDLVGSTPLSRRLDPEDLAEVISIYQSRATAAIERFGGYIARYVGDGILSYFGWPENTEADPERAVRAALAIVAGVTETPARGQLLQVRVGVATGLVIVGKPVGSGEARQLTATGQTPNLAARLQGLAEPNSIIIDDITRRQIGGLFTCRDLGDRPLKGFETPVRAWSVLGTRAVSDRFAALHAARLLPFISREKELALLLQRWRQAAAGDGQLVLLTGEAGIGKSRLVAELRRRLRGQLHTSLRYFCSPYYQASPLHPVITRLEHEAGFSRRDGPADKLRKLKAVLHRSRASAEDVSLIADLLGVPADDASPMPVLTPQARKARTFEALIRRVVALAGQHPLLMVAEDAHWADPSSLELLDRIIGLLPNLPVLLIVSIRGETGPPLSAHDDATHIPLARLARADATQLANEVLAGHRLPPMLLDRIIAQSEGVPLFIEELTKSVLENAESIAGWPPVLTVPTTLQASLTARLDRLSAGKRIAQIGAVIGRQFSRSQLAAVAEVPAGQLAEGLEELLASGLASRRNERVDVVYTFRHALFQEAIYDGLLRRRRAEIHARVVAVAEGDVLLGLTDPGLLGYHCAQAGLLAKAASYYRTAGGRSAERAAVAETRTYLERGLHFAGNLPDGPDRHHLEAELHIAHGRY